MTKDYKHLTLDDRIQIEKYSGLGDTIRQIALKLDRSPSTISREMRRGRWRPSNENAAYTPYRDPALNGSDLTPPQYRAERAQKKADA